MSVLAVHFYLLESNGKILNIDYKRDSKINICISTSPNCIFLKVNNCVIFLNLNLIN